MNNIFNNKDNDINVNVNDTDGATTSDEGLSDVDVDLDFSPPQPAWATPTDSPGHFSSTTSGEESSSAMSGEDSPFAVDLSPGDAAEDMDYMSTSPAPHESGIYYGSNMGDVAADNMTGHIAAQEPEPPFQQTQQKRERSLFEVHLVLTDASNSSNPKRMCRNGLPLSSEAKAKTGKAEATAGKRKPGKSKADKAKAAKLLRWKTDMETAMRDSATLEELHDSFLATAPASLQAKVQGCGQVSLGRMDQLLKPFVVIRSNRKLMRKFYKINGVSFGRQSSWPEMGIKSNGCTSLVNGMIELLALMHKFNHVHILVNTESKESNTTWKAKRAALIELDRDFGIRSHIEAADVHSGIKVIAIDILNQIAKADVDQKV